MDQQGAAVNRELKDTEEGRKPERLQVRGKAQVDIISSWGGEQNGREQNRKGNK